MTKKINGERRIKTFNIVHLANNYKQAYDNLPETYKQNNCLIFFVDVNNNLCAEFPKNDEEYLYIPPEKLHDMQESWTRIK